MWRPIETAPKDGTKVLLAKIAPTDGAPDLGIEPNPPHVWWCVQGYWSSKWKNWNDGVEPSGLAGPNFWTPTPSVRHCRKREYNDREQRHTCVSCAHPLADNQLVRDAYNLNTTAAWAKQRLAILHDMAKDRGLDWFAEQAQKIADRIQLLDADDDVLT